MPSADLQSDALAGDARAQVRWAVQLDELGRHHEALEWLARAAKAHEAEALARLGMKLLLADNAPSRPADGVGLLVEAAERGDGQSAATLALLAAGGFFAPQNWTVALDYLQRAAELGWTPAQEQLRMLSGDDAAASGAPSGETWRRLRQGVALAEWLRPPTPRVLCQSPRVIAIEALATPEVCDWMVGQCAGRLVRAEVDDPRTGLPVMGQTRTNRLANFGLAETSLLNVLLQSRIGAAIGASLSVMEAFAVLNYRPGEEASDHFDYLDPAVPAYAEEIARVGQRIATALLYLNDDYEGGETDFPELGLRHRGARGDALIFFSVDGTGAPDPRTRHAGRPPTSGEKWVLSQFIRDRPLAPVAG